MNKIDNISNDANQLIQVILDDGTTVNVNLIYRPSIERWTMNVSRETFSVDGINISVMPNIMREWRHLIPFGFACTTTDGADPIYIDDFSNDRAQLYVLSAAEVEEFEATILGAGT